MNFKCPSCQHSQIVTAQNSDFLNRWIYVGEGSRYGDDLFSIRFIRCLNAKCNELIVDYEHSITEGLGSNLKVNVTVERFFSNRKIIHRQRLNPKSAGQIFPDYVPRPIRDDYQEACSILELSPKASATLARRCIQGMIRDFCGVSKSRLIDEINVLQELSGDGNLPPGVSIESLEAIDHVRSIGNIGAHMERDINVIVEIDEDEAKVLLELVEQLIEDWYIARYTREQRLSKLKAISDAKKDAKKGIEAPDAAG